MAKDFRRINPNRLRWYCGLDVAATLQLHRWQRERMGPFLKTWRVLHGPALHALARVERWGALLSEENVRRYDAFLQARLEAARGEARGTRIPDDLNVKSAPQMQKLLFETLGLRPLSRTAAGAPSCSGDDLEALAKLHPDVPEIPIVARLAEYRSMLAMYGENQLKHVGYDGRVHTTYKIIRSGRLSSSDPNLQNLKSPDDDPNLAEEDDNGRWARGCWVAPEGHVIVNLDLSQHELRVACMLSGDEAMAEAFASGFDFHTATAARLFGKDPSKKSDEGGVTKLERRVAKVVNFRTVYGGTDYGLAQMLGITEEKAHEFSSAYDETYPALARWRRRQMADAATGGVSWARWDREGWTHARQIPDAGEVGDAGKQRRGHAERVAQNNPVQNLANCFALAGLVRCVQWIEDSGAPAELVMTVHDNVVLYAREDAWREVAAECRALLTGFDTPLVKIKADVELGARDLGHLEKVKDP